MYKIGPLYNKPFDFAVHKNFLNYNQIQYIYQNLKNLQFQTAKVGDTSIQDDEYRRSKVKWIPFSKTWNVLYSSVLGLIQEYNSYIWKFNLKESPNNFQYTEYHSTDSGKYDWHVDLGGNILSYRKLSVTIQLSDSNEYEGGDLQLFDGASETISEFPYTTIEKGLGTAVIFPSYMMHRVTPVTKGIRKSLVLWVGGKPFK